MKFIGNVIWFLTGGIFGGFSWTIAGLLWCITILGIPVGIQCFKIAALTFWPFGKIITYSGDPISCLFNIVWLIISGIPLAIGHFLVGLVFAITIIGIPFAKQSFKLARLSLAPFGATIIST